MKDGILNIYKPEKWTSHDVVAVLRRLTGVKKIGHTGTLDPMARGVLPVCIGKATRIIEYMENEKKTYRCGMRLGLLTDTLDIWGKVLEEKPAAADEEEVRKVLASYIGTTKQIPPMYSALKVKGKKLYEYAREGKEVEIKKREITIDGIYDISFDKDRQEIYFTCICSRGTYIRSLCRDIGEDLGTAGTMISLERLANGPFKAEDAADIEKLKEYSPAEIEALLIPLDMPLAEHGRICLDDNRVKKFCNGNTVGLEAGDICREAEEKYNVYDERGRFLGIGVCEGRSCKPEKILAT